MGISKALGKFVSKLAKKDKSGYTKKVAEEASVQRKVERMKKDELEKTAKSGTSTEKHYAKLELDRRSGNKETVKELKDRQKKFPGLISDKSLKNRINANKRKLQTSDDMRDSILNEYERATGENFNRGGVPAKKPVARKPVAAKAKAPAKKPVARKSTVRK